MDFSIPYLQLRHSAEPLWRRDGSSWIYCGLVRRRDFSCIYQLGTWPDFARDLYSFLSSLSFPDSYSLFSIIIPVMFPTVVRALALLGFLSNSVNSAAVHSNSLSVPWKRDGLSLNSHHRNAPRNIVRRGDYGPDNRGSWIIDGFDIDVDMDVKWPDTGKTVTVRQRPRLEKNSAPLTQHSTISRSQTRLVALMGLKGSCF